MTAVQFGLASAIRDAQSAQGLAIDEFVNEEGETVILSTISLGRASQTHLYESLVIGGALSGTNCQYTSKEDAITGHEFILETLRQPRHAS